LSDRPSFQFYPSDWTSNPNLKRCTFAERGVWLEVMCLMHDQPEYGVLRWPLKEIAEAVKCRAADLQALIRKGVLKGDDKQLGEAYIYTPRSGRKDGEPVTLLGTQSGPIWYSSRMVKDEHVRTIRAESAANGAAPKQAPKASPKGGLGADKGEPIGVGFGPRDAGTPAAPSSSSSSSSSDNTPTATARARPAGSIEVFPIDAAWEPGVAFVVQAKLLAVPVNDAGFMAEGLDEFRAHWIARPGELRTHSEWENALAKSLKHRAVMAADKAGRQAGASRPPRQGAHAGFTTKDYTAGVNEDGTLA
jgi:hypothetical protein